MTDIKELLKEFKHIAENGREQIDKYLAEGKKVVGVFPYYAPEEIIYAGGLVPYGVWGGQGPIDKAKEYFPTFYYSLALRCLEMGLDGSLDGLSASMVTTLDDTLRPFSQNYKVSVGRKIPMVFLNHAQHRKEEFGKNYVLLIPASAEEDENGEVEIQAYSFTENEDGTEGDLQPIPEDSDAEWDMIEEVFNSFMEE